MNGNKNIIYLNLDKFKIFIGKLLVWNVYIRKEKYLKIYELKS